MKRLTMLLAAAALPMPALAQHEGHGDPPAQPAPPPAAHPHAGHHMPAPQAAPAADPHAGHHMPAPQAAPAAGPHAGHHMPAPEAAPAADPHAGHGQSSATQPPVTPPPAEASSGPAHAADAFYDPADMASAREGMRREHGGLGATKLLIDRAEVAIRDGRDGYAWDAQTWHGGDIDKLWIKTEGEGAFGGAVEEAEVQALWSRAIDPWFDLQLGLRYDFRPDPQRAYLVAGVQGLAPYWFEVDGSVYLSDRGDLSARLEAEYDLRITQRLILQPRMEVDLQAQDVPDLGIGSGLSEAAVGARLRYESFPGAGPASIAPYVGVEYERAFGDTARFRRAAGEDKGGWVLLLGLRTWF